MEQVSQHTHQNQLTPRVYDYTNYRKYLADMLEYKKRKNSQYSASAFIRAAGFSSSSRGYFSHIINGNRNLSHSRIVGFAKACKLSSKEAKFFELLVLFNQASSDSEKQHYFEQLSASAERVKNHGFQLLQSQYNYLSCWYLPVIRELINLDDFNPDPHWIVAKLNQQVNIKMVKSALQDLLALKLIRKCPDRGYRVAEKVLQFDDTVMNFQAANSFHKEILSKSIDFIDSKNYNDRSASCIIISTDTKNFKNIREEIREFREYLIEKYAVNTQKTNSVMSVSIQLNKFTNEDKKEYF